MNRKSYDYSELIESFGREKIESCYTALFEYFESTYKRNKYEECVKIANSVLNQAVVVFHKAIDYMED